MRQQNHEPFDKEKPKVVKLSVNEVLEPFRLLLEHNVVLYLLLRSQSYHLLLATPIDGYYIYR